MVIKNNGLGSLKLRFKGRLCHTTYAPLRGLKESIQRKYLEKCLPHSMCSRKKLMVLCFYLQVLNMTVCWFLGSISCFPISGTEQTLKYAIRPPAITGVLETLVFFLVMRHKVKQLAFHFGWSIPTYPRSFHTPSIG